MKKTHARSRRAKAFAPASISNLGAGFDVLGLAIDKPGDIAIAERSREPGLHFSVKGAAENTVPGEASKNVAAYVTSLLLDEVKPSFGVRLTLEKKMPVGSGLGSSAASSVAALVAVNELLRTPLKRHDLLRYAVEGERLASGSPHADNVAPSLLGGLCLIRSYDPLDVVPIPVHHKFVWVVVHPHLVVRTEEARMILPHTVHLRTAIRQWGNLSGLTAALMTGDTQLLSRCIKDYIAEPVRSPLILGFDAVHTAALEAGALACSISGSGPSLFAVTTSLGMGHKIGDEMVRTFKKVAGVHADLYVSRVNMHGAKILRP